MRSAQASGPGSGSMKMSRWSKAASEPRLLGEQHAVAEHVARHVADADHAEGLALDIDVHLAEMALHALPGAARGDAHALVVVAGRAAGGEGVAEPEAVRLRDLVGDVGEGGGALVGGDDQVGVVLVVAHDVAWRHDFAVLDVVGDVEQGGDEDAVGGNALLLDLLARAAARQPLRQKAALGARGHDDGVLDALGANETQHLGAEILGAVGPADAAAGDRRKAQVHTLHARRVDPDLAEGARLRRGLHGMAVELEGQRRDRAAGRIRLVEVGAHRGRDEVQELAQDAVLIEARHGGKRGLDAGADRRLRLPAGGRIEAAGGIEPQMEELQELAGERGMAVQRVGEVAQTEGRAELAQVGRIGPEHGNLAPVGAGADDQAIEAVVVGLAAEDGAEALLQPLVVAANIDRRAVGRFEHHVVQGDVALAILEARQDVVGALVDGREAHVLEHRHALRQADRRAEAVDGGVDAMGRRIRLAIEIDGDRAIGTEPLDALDVLERALCRKRLGVARRESRAVLGLQVFGPAAETGDGIGQPVVPGADDVGDVTLERGRIGLRRLARIARDDELHPHQRPMGEVGIERDHAALVGFRQQVADLLAHPRVVAVAGNVDERRHEPVEAVDAGEHANTRAGLELEDSLGPLLQLVRADLEQLVAGKRVQNVEQRLAVVAGRRIAGRLDHARHLVAQERDLGRRAHIGLRGEKADEADLAGGGSAAAVGLDADVVHVRAPVHAGDHIGLGDDERRGRKEEPAHLRRHGDELGSAPQHLDGLVAQDAEAGAAAGDEVAGLGITVELVLARAKEGEIAGLQPFQEGNRFGQEVGRHVPRPGLELGDRPAEALEHRPPVRDDRAHLVQNATQRVDEIAPRGIVEQLGVDGDVAFLAPVRPAPVAGADDVLQAPGLVAPGLEDGVEQVAHVEPARLQLAHHRVDQERHVVIEDLDDGAFLDAQVRRLAAQTDLVPSAGLLGDEIQGLADIAGEPVGRRPGQLLEVLAPVEKGGERHRQRPLAQRLRHLPVDAVLFRLQREAPWRFLPRQVEHARFGLLSQD